MENHCAPVAVGAAVREARVIESSSMTSAGADVAARSIAIDAKNTEIRE
jgi:hypothetical protein